MIEGKHIHSQKREITKGACGVVDTVRLDISADTRSSFSSIVVEVAGPFAVKHAQELSDAIHAVLEGK